mmetsp:Transcript_10595/g.25833  ORF Transcript_10595/g.25833 Transcript_10595/m.25833 type:complete len:1089 (+) Transcript_10595:81-3347(+)|eukprot:CAMPEP_0179001444 /NCGR_PEP_ID=MMETSP0795-20121207/11369_1 /TAXON_ID=88552 /ORGANISM="Amoebophrya sp., Strain Ameob2" /LENGTH=1088 /DNA_ID=CAMNT_0020694829 /DNA_START=44 /DNA_END=3310 /DNA_ORIENTATION=+
MTFFQIGSKISSPEGDSHLPSLAEQVAAIPSLSSLAEQVSQARELHVSLVATEAASYQLLANLGKALDLRRQFEEVGPPPEAARPVDKAADVGGGAAGAPGEGAESVVGPADENSRNLAPAAPQQVQLHKNVVTTAGADTAAHAQWNVMKSQVTMKRMHTFSQTTLNDLGVVDEENKPTSPGPAGALSSSKKSISSAQEKPEHQLQPASAPKIEEMEPSSSSKSHAASAATYPRASASEENETVPVLETGGADGAAAAASAPAESTTAPDAVARGQTHISPTVRRVLVDVGDISQHSLQQPVSASSSSSSSSEEETSAAPAGAPLLRRHHPEAQTEIPAFLKPSPEVEAEIRCDGKNRKNAGPPAVCVLTTVSSSPSGTARARRATSPTASPKAKTSRSVLIKASPSPGSPISASRMSATTGHKISVQNIGIEPSRRAGAAGQENTRTSTEDTGTGSAATTEHLLQTQEPPGAVLVAAGTATVSSGPGAAAHEAEAAGPGPGSGSAAITEETSYLYNTIPQGPNDEDINQHQMAMESAALQAQTTALQEYVARHDTAQAHAAEAHANAAQARAYAEEQDRAAQESAAQGEDGQARNFAAKAFAAQAYAAEQEQAAQEYAGQAAYAAQSYAALEADMMNRAAAEAADEGNYINSMMILQQQELPTTADQMDEPLLQPEPQGAPPGPPAVPAVVNAAMNMNSSAAPLVPQLNIAAAATKLAKIKKAAAGAKEKLGKSKSSKDEKKSKKAAAGAAGVVVPAAASAGPAAGATATGSSTAAPAPTAPAPQVKSKKDLLLKTATAATAAVKMKKAAAAAAGTPKAAPGASGSAPAGPPAPAVAAPSRKSLSTPLKKAAVAPPPPATGTGIFAALFGGFGGPTPTSSTKPKGKGTEPALLAKGKDVPASKEKGKAPPAGTAAASPKSKAAAKLKLRPSAGAGSAAVQGSLSPSTALAASPAPAPPASSQPVGASPGAMVVVPQQGGDDEAGLHDEAVFEKHEDEFHTVKTGAKVKRLGVHTSARTSKGLSPRPDFNPEHRNTSSSEESTDPGHHHDHPLFKKQKAQSQSTSAGSSLGMGRGGGSREGGDVGVQQ